MVVEQRTSEMGNDHGSVLYIWNLTNQGKTTNLISSLLFSNEKRAIQVGFKTMTYCYKADTLQTELLS